MPTEPTILVKKADGSFVRMPLSQVRAQGVKGAEATVAAPKIKAVAPAPKEAPQKTTPLSRNAKAMPESARVSDEDFSSPLEEPSLAGEAPRISASRDTEIARILKQIRFALTDDQMSRLRSAIQLRLKDVRTVEQTRGSLTRPLSAGGAGLTTNQAAEVLLLCGGKAAHAIHAPKQPDEANLPMLATPLMPATSTPVNSFVHSKAIPFSSQSQLSGVMPASTASTTRNHQAFKLDTTARPKPVMADVFVPATTVGPTDEIRAFTLTDFRRLGKDPAVASAALQHKFINLKAESIIFYLEARAAWRQSPLYREYLATIAESLVNHQKLTTIRPSPDRIRYEEIKALVAMERSL